MGRYFENNSQLFRVARDAIRERNNGAHAIGIFGSRARRTQRIDSDVDLIVLNERNNEILTKMTDLGPRRYLSQFKWNDTHIVRASNSIFEELNTDLLTNIKKDVIWIWKKDISK